MINKSLKLKYFYIILAAAFMFVALQLTTELEPVKMSDPEDTLYLELENGRVVIEMFPDVAPGHVAHIKKLVREEFYDGITFHRVISGFMAQTGDPKGDGTGGSGRHIGAELSVVKPGRWARSQARGRGVKPTPVTQFFFSYPREPVR